MKKIVTLLIAILSTFVDIWADTTVELYVGEEKLLDAISYMNLSNAISNVKFDIDSDKLHERTDGWSTVVAPRKYYDGEATVKCTWTEKDQHTPYPYTTYYKSQTWKVRCKDNPIVLYTTELKLKPGEYGNIRVDCTNSNVSYYYNCRYEWHFSTSNSSVATVQQTGLVEAIGPGQTQIVISSPNAREDKYCKVIVEPAQTPTTKLSLTASPSGGEVSAGTIVTLTAKADGSTVSGCDIFYTLNGYTPSRYSTPYTSSGITISNDCTLKAIAYKDGYEDSDELTATYKIKQPNGISIDAINFPDENFRNYLLAQDYGKDRVLTESEINGITSISVSDKNICSLKGIEYFTALKSLYCYNNQLTTLDVSNNTALKTLWCDNNQLTTLDVSKNTALKTLWCDNNQLTTLDVSKNTALEELHCYDNKLTTLDVSNNTALKTLWCDNNQLTTLDVSKNTALTSLYCSGNQLTALDVSKNTALKFLDCYRNQLTALDVSKNTALDFLYCYSNQLTALDVSNNTALEILYCHSNQLTTLDVSKNTALTSLYCSGNQLTALDVSKNTALEILYCHSNQLTALDVSKNTALEILYCHSNQLTALDVSKNTALKTLACVENQLTTLDVSKNTALTYLYCSGNQLTALDVSKNTALTYLNFFSNNIRGTAMDNLIKGLPVNTTSDVHHFCIIDPTDEKEGNIGTKTQMAAVKEKGWFPCFYDRVNGLFIEYEGSDEDQTLQGDVNLDGSVNGTDLVALSNIVLGRKEQTASADVNNDGSVNGTDYVALVNIILGRNKATKVSVWKNDGSAGEISWSGQYRFGLEGNDGNNECIATFSQDIWDRIKSETFYVTFKGESPQIRVTSGWWSTTWTGDDIFPGNELLTDNGDGTFTLTVNLAGDPLLDVLDVQHLLFTGSGYTVEEIYFIDIIPGGGGGAKEEVFWQGDGSTSSNVSATCPITAKTATVLDHLSIDSSFDIKAGEEREMLINLTNPNDVITLVQFDLRLPSGLTLKQTDGEYDFDMAGRSTWRKHSLEANDMNGIIRFILASNSNTTLSGTEGAIIKMTIKADDSFTSGDIQLENILMVTPDEKETKQGTYVYSVGSTEPPIQETTGLDFVTFDVDEEGDTELVIGLNNPDDEITLIQFDLSLPSGLTLKRTEEDYAIDIAGRTTWRKHSLDANATNGIVRFLLASSSNATLSGTEGAVIKMSVKTDKNFNSGTVRLDNILLVTPDEKEIKPSAISFVVDPVNVKDIIAEEFDKQAPIYNLSGQRLEKPRKGVNIVGGKKVLVK